MFAGRRVSTPRKLRNVSIPCVRQLSKTLWRSARRRADGPEDVEPAGEARLRLRPAASNRPGYATSLSSIDERNSMGDLRLRSTVKRVPNSSLSGDGPERQTLRTLIQATPEIGAPLTVFVSTAPNEAACRSGLRLIRCALLHTRRFLRRVHKRRKPIRRGY